MNKLLILLFTLSLTSCDRELMREGQAMLDATNTLIVGSDWNLDKSLYRLEESNEDWAKYMIDIGGYHYYYTVKNNKVVSVWVKRAY